jgi:hypothetical protein
MSRFGKPVSELVDNPGRSRCKFRQEDFSATVSVLQLGCRTIDIRGNVTFNQEDRGLHKVLSWSQFWRKVFIVSSSTGKVNAETGEKFKLL